MTIWKMADNNAIYKIYYLKFLKWTLPRIFYNFLNNEDICFDRYYVHRSRTDVYRVINNGIISKFNNIFRVDHQPQHEISSIW